MTAQDRIETEVRSFCDALPLSFVHIEVAVAEGKRAGDAEFGKLVANRIATKVQALRERFNVHFDRS